MANNLHHLQNEIIKHYKAQMDVCCFSEQGEVSHDTHNVTFTFPTCLGAVSICAD